MKFKGNTSEYLHLQTVDGSNCEVLSDHIEGGLTVFWFQSDNNILTIDGKDEPFAKNDIVFLTEFHKIETKKVNELRLLRFNRPFYCILDHDTEVSCKGILFFGASQLPIINLPAEEVEKFEILWKMFTIEMQSDDNLQIGMLQMMLKRFLILSTRLYRQASQYPNGHGESDIIREFNFMVEQHFKTKHTVAEYAELLHKSPKTLSNIFSKMGSKSPLQYIQERKMLEARRLLHYTNLQVKEIAYELGYEEVQAFSRFFKNQEGISPKEYKENK